MSVGGKVGLKVLVAVLFASAGICTFYGSDGLGSCTRGMGIICGRRMGAGSCGPRCTCMLLLDPCGRRMGIGIGSNNGACSVSCSRRCGAGTVKDGVRFGRGGCRVRLCKGSGSSYGNRLLEGVRCVVPNCGGCTSCRCYRARGGRSVYGDGVSSSGVASRGFAGGAGDRIARSGSFLKVVGEC